MTFSRPARLALLACLSTLLLGACTDSQPIHLPLTPRGNIQMPHETAARTALFDLLTVDPRRGVLYVPHTSNSELEVVDTRSQKLIGTVGGLPSVRAVALTPDPNVVFLSESTGGAIAVVDTSAMKVLATIPVKGAPDAVGYDNLDDAVVATSSGANALTVIDRTGRKVTSSIQLPGAPELMAVDATTGIAYIAINDKNEVAAVTVANGAISLLKGCDIQSPTGLALDDNGHLFVANPRLVSVIDLLVDRCLGSVDIGNGVDQIAINTQLHHLYTANGGSRNVSVIDTKTFRPLGEVGTGPSGDGVAADASTGLVYVMVGRAGIVAVYHDP